MDAFCCIRWNYPDALVKGEETLQLSAMVVNYSGYNRRHRNNDWNLLGQVIERNLGWQCHRGQDLAHCRHLFLLLSCCSRRCFRDFGIRFLVEVNHERRGLTAIRRQPMERQRHGRFLKALENGVYCDCLVHLDVDYGLRYWFPPR